MASQSLWGNERQLAQQARPFLRWAGGKQRWLNSNAHLLPRFRGQYFEPFLGGGSIFFHLVRTETRPFEAWLGDNNLQLVRAYNDIRNSPHEVIDSVNTIAAAYREAIDKRRFYEEVRQSFNDALPKSNTARFIFLNASCWNGLWRTNAKGRFNVPYGAPKSDQPMPTAEEILCVSAALQNARIRSSSWENLVSAAGEGDFVFLDPPYFSDSLSRAQPKYGSVIFGYREHAKLAETLMRLHERGVLFLLTNSGEPEMVALYRELGLTVREVMVPRAISSKVDERQAVGEVIVTNTTGRTFRNSSAAVLLDLEILRSKRKTEGAT